MKHALVSFLLVLGTVLGARALSAQQNDLSPSAESEMKIRIIVNGKELSATLEDNAAARDLAAMLPMDITLEDYHGIEKIFYLPSRLPTDGVPDGIDPDVGDITYFAPWGNLALFYRDFGFSRGLVRLGRIESGVEHLADGDAISVRIEPVEGSE